MKISFDCAVASWTAPSTPVTARASAAALSLNFISPPPLRWVLRSMRERPKPELLLAYRPEARKPARLDDQEEHDQGAEDHELDVRDHRRRQRDAQPRRQLVEHQR